MVTVYYITNPAGDLSDQGYKLLRYGVKELFGITDYEVQRHPKGKPYLRDHENVHFSISHTDSCVACAVSDIPVGIDVQSVTSVNSTRVAEKLYTSAEKEYTADDPVRFCEIWTRKESFVKLTGEGITRELSHIDTVTGENTGGAVFIPIEIPDIAACLCINAMDTVTLTELTEDRL